MRNCCRVEAIWMHSKKIRLSGQTQEDFWYSFPWANLQAFTDSNELDIQRRYGFLQFRVGYQNLPPSLAVKVFTFSCCVPQPLWPEKSSVTLIYKLPQFQSSSSPLLIRSKPSAIPIYLEKHCNKKFHDFLHCTPQVWFDQNPIVNEWKEQGKQSDRKH